MKIIGKHIMVDMYGCSARNLENAEFIKEMSLRAIDEATMNLVDFTCHMSQPYGMTALTVTVEGHLAIHTYPQLGYAAIDVFTCCDYSRPEAVVSVLKRCLKPEKTKMTSIKRGDFGSIKDMKPKTSSSMAPFRRVKNTSKKVLNLLKVK